MRHRIGCGGVGGRLAVGLVVVLSVPGHIRAHDFWIEPSEFVTSPGATLQVALRVGQRFEGDPVPRIPSQVARFILEGAEGELPIDGRENQEPAGTIKIGKPGTYVLGYRSRPSKVELEAGKFEAYLADEGLERIVALRARRGESAKPGREIFSRCAKSIVVAGDPRSVDLRGFDRLLGFTLEVTPERNPYALHAAGEIPFRLLYEGNPVEGALVIAMSAEAPGHPLKARSDGGGRAVFTLGPGIWLVKAVHMIPAPSESGADWESLWASVTFQIPAPGAGASTP